MAKYYVSATNGKKATLNDLKRFVDVPFFIPEYHSKESHQVFPLFLNEIGDLNANKTFIPVLIERNPYFDHTEIKYFVATADDNPVGRIAAFVDSRYNQEQLEKHGDTRTTGWVGMFECIEDLSLAQELFKRARNYLKDKGCDLIIGPAKFNANGPVGLLVKGFEHEPYFMEPYNASYYPKFFEDYGFAQLDDWYTLRVDDTSAERVKQYIDKAEKLENIIKQSKTRGKVLREATFRQADFKHMDAEIQVLDREYNGNWEKGEHPQFETMTKPELMKLGNDVKLVTRPEYVIIVEHDGHPVGISASALNIYEKISDWDQKHPNYMPSLKFWSPRDLKRDLSIFFNILHGVRNNTFESLRVLILGVDEDYRGTGLDGALYSRCFKAAMKNGIKRASLSQLAERNRDIVNPLTNIAGNDYIICRVYSRDI